MHYLGHVIGGGQVTPDPQKLDAMRDYPTPVSKKQVRAFWDLQGIIAALSHTSQPLLSHLLNSQKAEILTK